MKELACPVLGLHDATVILEVEKTWFGSWRIKAGKQSTFVDRVD